MTAHLYIIAESFQNHLYSNEEVEQKIERLAEDVVFINHNKESNKLFANYNEVYPQIFLAKFTLFDFICNPGEVKKYVNRNVVNAVQNIFRKAFETSISIKEVREVLLGWNDEFNCNGLIAFNKVDGVDESIQLIYGRDNWLKFRRHFLGLYPKDGEFFIKECAIYFPNLAFHQQNEKTVAEILSDFSKTIIRHLGHLNDIFFTYRQRTFENESIKYKTLTSECKLDADAASKDTNASKENLSFE